VLTRSSSIERFRLLRKNPPALEWTERVGTANDGWGRIALVASIPHIHAIIWQYDAGAVIEVRQVLPFGSRLIVGSIDGLGVARSKPVAEAVVRSISEDQALCPAGCHHRSGYIGVQTDSGEPVICWNGWTDDGGDTACGTPILCLRSMAVLWPDGTASPVADRTASPSCSIVHLVGPITRSS